MRVGSVVIDCNDFAAMFAFWRQVLRYVPREPAEEGWVVLRDPENAGVNISLQKVPEPRTGKNRLHLDLYSIDLEAEVARLRGLGATVHRRESNPEEDYVTFEDPEGNLFCVAQVAVP